MSQLFFRRGMLLGEQGKLADAKTEFMKALDEASRDSIENNRQEVLVISHDALGILAWTGGDYKEALKWFSLADEEQTQFGKVWVADIKSKKQRMLTLMGSK